MESPPIMQTVGYAATNSYTLPPGFKKAGGRSGQPVSTAGMTAKILAPTQVFQPNVSKVHFGLFACGVCPFCLAGAQVQKEVDSIKALQKARKETDDTKIVVGQASKSIRGAGEDTGADARSKYIGNEDGTRLQKVASGDYEAILLATLPRIYENAKAMQYKIVGNPKDHSKGIENGLYKKMVSGLQQASRTDDYAEDALPRLQEKLLNHLGKDVKTFGIYHHLGEGAKVRETGRTIPVLAGYAATASLRPHELFIPSVRELPRFETLGLAPGGLMNTLAMGAKNGHFKEAYVVVEPWQHDLKKYIGSLEKDHGLAVEDLSAKGTSHIPGEYREFMHDAHVSTDATLYKIPLGKLKDEVKKLPTETEEPDPGKRDTCLMESIKLHDPTKEEQKQFLMKQRSWLPSLFKISILKPFFPNYNGLKERKPEDNPAPNSSS